MAIYLFQLRGLAIRRPGRELLCTLLRTPTVLTTQCMLVEWRFQIIYAIRTSYRGGVSFHNTNRITFKIIRDFARFLPW